MTIAIDYDGTWTADPSLWHHFADQARLRGHTVIMVTARRIDQPVSLVPHWMHVYYTAGRLKDEFMRAHGCTVDVWIDDTPGMIQECRVIRPSPDESL